MGSPIAFSGLASGLDSQSIIDALMSVARQPITRLEGKKDVSNTKLNLITDLTTKLSSLQSAVNDLDTEADFKSFKATSSNEDKATATATASAAPGNYTFQVTSLCQAERSYSNQYTSKTTGGVAGTGTLQIQIGDEDETIDILATDTLEGIASKINDLGISARAGVMYNGDSDNPQYRLVVNGTKAGEDYDITFTESGSVSLNLDGHLDAIPAGPGDPPDNQVQAAADAEIVLEPDSLAITVKSSSNTITDAIPGVTLNLLETTGADTITTKVEVDQDEIEGKVKAFVTAYNSIISFLNGQFSFNGEARDDTLMGDSTARTVKMQVMNMISTQVPALAGSLDTLSQIGVTSDSKGILNLDSAKFREKLGSDLEAVCDLFAYTDGDDDTDNDGVAVRFNRILDGMLQTPDGLMPTKKTSLNNEIRSYDDQIANIERNLDSYEEKLRKQYTALEEMMASLQRQQSAISGING